MELETLKIGDRIVGKKTGTLTPATIIGFLPAQYHSLSRTNSRWDELYPDWREKYLVFAEYDEPTRSCSFQEFTEQYNFNPQYETSPFLISVANDKKLYQQFIEHQYNTQILPTTSVCFPIDDVDLLC